MKQASLFIALILFFLSSAFCQSSDSFVPKPVKFVQKAGSFRLSASSHINVPNDNTKIANVAGLFTDQLMTLSGIRLEIGSEKDKTSIDFLLNKQFDVELGEEGYFLDISAKNINISANTAAGLFYGSQTLLQMIPPQKADSSIDIACAEITDYPRFGWRGLMLDVSRHFFTKDEVKRYIDQMVKYKYNVFHWHLTDNNGWRIEIKSYPKLTSVGSWRIKRTGRYNTFQPKQPGEEPTDGGFYTQEDIKEIVKYAADRYVTIIPEIDVPGHSCALIAAYPEVSCTGNHGDVFVGAEEPLGEDVFCVGEEQNFKMLDDIFGEISALFPSKYIHIGGDEANRHYWKDCPKCEQRIEDEHLEDLEELQSYFTKRVSKILASKGKKLIGWDEILEGGLAPDATVMSWRGIEGAIAAAKSGHHAVMSPTSNCYFDYLQGEWNIERNCYGKLRAKTVYSFELVPEGVDASYILGGQGNVWTELIPNFRRVEYMTWPRALALAEVLWSPNINRDWDEFVPRMEAQFPRFEQAEVNYAPSIYDPEISMIKTNDGENRIVFSPEIRDMDIYYTFDITFPDKFSPKYENESIEIPKGASEIWAITYRDGKPLGRLLVITIDDLKKRM